MLGLLELEELTDQSRVATVVEHKPVHSPESSRPLAVTRRHYGSCRAEAAATHTSVTPGRFIWLDLAGSAFRSNLHERQQMKLLWFHNTSM